MRSIVGLLFFALGVLAGCSAPVDYRLGVPSAADFADPVPIRVADVRVGETGGTSLGPNDGPMVVLHIEPEYRDRVCTDTRFVMRRASIVSGPLHLEMIPGQGEPVLPGHYFDVERFDPMGQARDWIGDVMGSVRDAKVEDRLLALRERIDAAVAAGRDRWAEEQPALEADLQDLVGEVESDSEHAAAELRRWFDEAVEDAERSVRGSGDVAQ